MECPNCLKSYDQEESVPLILTNCGHSLCHMCIGHLFENQTVICPLCGESNHAESSSSFTKNLALLQILNEAKHGMNNGFTNPKLNQTNDHLNSSGSYSMGDFIMKSSKDSDSCSVNSLNQFGTVCSTNICQEHQKQIEAFCWNDKIGLCIECILSQQVHKSHEVFNIEKSMEKQDGIIQKLKEKINESKCNLTKQQDAIVQQTQEVHRYQQEQNQTINKFFDNIKAVIEKQQNQAIKKVQQQFDTQIKYINDQESRILELQKNLNSDSMFKEIQKENRLYFLLQQIDQEKQAIKFNDQCEKLMSSYKKMSFESFDCKKEIQELQKLIGSISNSQNLGKYISKVNTQRRPSLSGTIDTKSSNNNPFGVSSTQNTRISNHRDLSQVNSKKTINNQKEQSTIRQKINLQQKPLCDEKNEKHTPTHNQNTNQRINNIPLKNQKKQDQQTDKSQEHPSQRPSLQINLQQEKHSVNNQLKSQQTPIKQFDRQAAQAIQKQKTQVLKTQERATFRLQQQTDQKDSKPTQGVGKVTNNGEVKLRSAASTKQIFKSESKINIQSQNNNDNDELPQVSASKNFSKSKIFRLPHQNKVKVVEDLNNSLNESNDQNDEAASYNSISKLVQEKQHLFQNTQIRMLPNPAQSQKQLLNNTIFQNTTNVMHLNIDDQDCPKTPFMNTTNLNDYKLSSTKNASAERMINNSALASAKPPCLKEMRNSIKQEKKLSIQHQLEKEQWKTRQAQNVENISQQRQMSSRRTESQNTRLINQEQYQGEHKREVRMSLCPSEMRQSNKFAPLTDRIFETCNVKHINNDFDVIDDDHQVISFQNSNSPKSMSLSLNALEINQILLEKNHYSKQSAKSPFFGIIGGSFPDTQRSDSTGLTLDLFDQRKSKYTQKLNFSMNSQFNPECVQFLVDPRNSSNILIIGEKHDNGKFSKQIRMINLKKLIEEDSGIPELPFKEQDDSLYLTATQGFYNIYSEKVPGLFISIASKSQPLTVYSFNFQQEQWNQLPALDIKNLIEYQLAINNNSLFLIGGHIKNTVSKGGYRFDFEEFKWAQLPNMNNGRAYFNLITTESGVMALGGYDGEQVLSTCETYNEASQKWEMNENMNCSRMYSGSSYGNNKVYVFGGIDNQDAVQNSLEYFDMNTKQWVLIQFEENNQISRRFNLSVVQANM